MVFRPILPPLARPDPAVRPMPPAAKLMHGQHSPRSMTLAGAQRETQCVFSMQQRARQGCICRRPRDHRPVDQFTRGNDFGGLQALTVDAFKLCRDDHGPLTILTSADQEFRTTALRPGVNHLQPNRTTGASFVQVRPQPPYAAARASRPGRFMASDVIRPAQPILRHLLVQRPARQAQLLHHRHDRRPCAAASCCRSASARTPRHSPSAACLRSSAPAPPPRCRPSAATRSTPTPAGSASTARSAMFTSCRTFPGQGACNSCAASCAVTCGASQPYSSANCSRQPGEQRQDILAPRPQAAAAGSSSPPAGRTGPAAAPPPASCPAHAGCRSR